MKAITTKYIPATNAKPARISASDMDGNRIVVSYSMTLEGMECYAQAAEALRIKMGWPDIPMIAGATLHGYVFVFMPTSA